MTEIEDIEDLIIDLCHKCIQEVLKGKNESIRDMKEFKILMRNIKRGVFYK